MSHCWSEGALRAHLDRELPPEDMELVAAHLAGCAECSGISKHLAERAGRIALWMDALPEPGISVAPQMPRPARARRVWIGLGAAIAARHENVVTGPPGAAALVPPAAPVMEQAPSTSNPLQATPAAASTRFRRPIGPAVARTRRPLGPAVARIRQPAARNFPPRDSPPRDSPPPEFLPLDDEPIETGVVMRIGVEPGNVQADVVFGPDGRAHAIRLVNARK